MGTNGLQEPAIDLKDGKIVARAIHFSREGVAAPVRRHQLLAASLCLTGEGLRISLAGHLVS
jgi:hypothetical protein